MANPLFLRSKLFEKHGLTALFTQRNGGISPSPFNTLNFGRELGDSHYNIDTNLRSLIQAAQLPSCPHEVKQVHGINGLICSGAGKFHIDEADYLLSNRAGTALAVRTADCLPILLADPKANIIAAVHAGWRGTAARIATRAMDQMMKLGATKTDIIATLGPCIGSCCFEIGDEAASALTHCCNGAELQVSSQGAKQHADLSAINQLQLHQCGLNSEQIESISACTMCQPEHYFSYRRDGINSGRHLAIVALAARP